MNKGFRSLSDRIIESLFARSPLLATTYGVHSHDRELDRLDLQARLAHRAEVRDQLRELKAYEIASLSHTEQMDLSVLQGQLQVLLRWDEDIKVYERDANRYLVRLLDALFHAAVREYSPELERGKALLKRLQQLPAYLDTAAQNLRQGYDLPAVWTEIAVETADGADRFFRETLLPFAARCGKIQEELSDATEGARRSLLRFRAFLQNDLLPRCDGAFAVGRDFFEFLLEKEHGLHLKCKDLLLLGEDSVASIRGEMERAAKEISTRKSLGDVIRDIRREHPKADKLLDAYRRETERARDFVVSRELLTLPENDRLSVVETPPFARPTVPYGGYVAPAPFESKQEGLFWVTPVDPELKAAEVRQRLEEHNVYELPLMAIHEAYPGHHVQTLYANRASSKVRRVFWTPVFSEGWALYCEELALAHGYSDDPKVRLMGLKWQLMRACRVLVDVKLHLQQMTFAEAVDVLTSVAGVDRTSALAEVKRYTLTPTQPMSYFVGKREIERLRDDYRSHRGERFKLKDFHDKLLGYGSVPPAFIRDAMLH